MNGFTKLSVVAASILCVGIATGANAEGLKEKVIGAWTLSDGSEVFQDGKKVTPWAVGSLILDPDGPMVAYLGTYTVNDADNMLTYKVDYAANPIFDGAVRTQKVAFKGDLMTYWFGAQDTAGDNNSGQRMEES